jgi:hypothetical protein
MGHPGFLRHLNRKCKTRRGAALTAQPLFALTGGIYWLTPLARKPPSTTRVCPVTKEAASEAR